MSSDISVEPQNPRDFETGDLEDLAAELQKALPDYSVRALAGDEMPSGARGVTWWEVVHVYLPTVGDEVRAVLVAEALRVAYQWAKRRFKRKAGHGAGRRPKCVILHDADGNEIGSVVLRSGRHKPVTKEEAVAPTPIRRKKSGSREPRAQKRRKPG